MENVLAVAGSHSKYKLPGMYPAGFLAGLWHGIIAPITFFISLFIPGVSVYETHNNGRWYEFGFMLGIGGFTAGASTHRGSCG
jgi:hypothetical protein